MAITVSKVCILIILGLLYITMDVIEKETKKKDKRYLVMN